MKIITICGTTKYEDTFKLVNLWLTLQENCVFTVSCFGHAEVDVMREETKEVLDRVHFGKIDASEEIFVVDVMYLPHDEIIAEIIGAGGRTMARTPNPYIGFSTSREIAHAEATGKTVRYLSKEFDQFQEWADSIQLREENCPRHIYVTV